MVNIENNLTTNEMYKVIHLALILNPEVSILVENPGVLKPQFTDDDDSFIFEVAKGSSSKVAPGFLDEQEMFDPISDESSPENTESEERRITELTAREKRDLEKIKKIRSFKRRRTCINCLRKCVCFKDDENVFDHEIRIPTCKQVCCWRLLRARRLSHRFHASDESLLAFEKSKYQGFIAILISVNYLILYTVLLYPFVLIAQEKLFGGTEDEEDTCTIGKNTDGTCMQEGQTMPKPESEDTTESGALTFNEIMLIVNGGVLLYQLICELIMIAVQKNRAKMSCCNQYLLIQVFNGVTLRAVILISAQLVAAFITQVNLLSYTIGICLGVSLILS